MRRRWHRKFPRLDGLRYCLEGIPRWSRRVQFWGVRRHLQQKHILWHCQLWRAMPSCPVHDEQSNCPRADAFPNFNQVLVHGFDVDGRQDQSAANAAGRAHRGEQIRPVEAPVAYRARAGASPGQPLLHPYMRVRLSTICDRSSLLPIPCRGTLKPSCFHHPSQKIGEVHMS